MQSFAGDIPMLDAGMAEFQAAMRIIDVLFRIPTPIKLLSRRKKAAEHIAAIDAILCGRHSYA
jgi:hypothetical protein